MKRLLIVTGWWFGCLLTISVAGTTLHFLRQTQTLTPVSAAAGGLTLRPGDHTLPVVQGISSELTAKDARPYIIAQFLERYDSPLKPYDYWGDYLTMTADKYGLDFRLLPAIAMQESNVCKKIPENTYNCLGLGIHKRGTWGFDSFEANFDKAAEILRKNYINQGLITPDEIQDKYTPSSNGSWEFSVNKFMDKLEKAEW